MVELMHWLTTIDILKTTASIIKWAFHMWVYDISCDTFTDARGIFSDPIWRVISHVMDQNMWLVWHFTRDDAWYWHMWLIACETAFEKWWTHMQAHGGVWGNLTCGKNDMIQEACLVFTCEVFPGKTWISHVFFLDDAVWLHVSCTL